MNNKENCDFITNVKKDGKELTIYYKITGDSEYIPIKKEGDLTLEQFIKTADDSFSYMSPPTLHIDYGYKPILDDIVEDTKGNDVSELVKQKSIDLFE